MKYLTASGFQESGPQGLSIECQQQFQTSLATLILRNQNPVQIQSHKCILQAVAPLESKGRLCFHHTLVSPFCLGTASGVTAQGYSNLYSPASILSASCLLHCFLTSQCCWTTPAYGTRKRSASATYAALGLQTLFQLYAHKSKPSSLLRCCWRPLLARLICNTTSNVSPRSW